MRCYIIFVVVFDLRRYTREINLLHTTLKCKLNQGAWYCTRGSRIVPGSVEIYLLLKRFVV